MDKLLLVGSMFGVFRGSNWGVWGSFGVRVGVENLDEFLENSDSLRALEGRFGGL